MAWWRNCHLPPLPEPPLPQLVEESTFPIPPNPERPFGENEGDRLFVQEFILEGAVDRLEHGISIEELVELLENSRMAAQGLDVVGKDGFTEEERAQVVEFFPASGVAE